MKPGLYRHFKGNLYRVSGIVVAHSETQEEMVLYKSMVYKTWWVRPIYMFSEYMVRDQYAGPRFARLPWYKQVLMFWKR